MYQSLAKDGTVPANYPQAPQLPATGDTTNGGTVPIAILPFQQIQTSGVAQGIFGFQVMYKLFIFLQYVILLGSVSVLLILRLFYSAFIIRLRPTWSPPHNGHTRCWKNLVMSVGIMYAVSTMGIVEFFLYRDAVKKLDKKRLPIRAILKLVIEGLTVLYFAAALIVVYWVQIFRECGDTDDVRDANKIMEIGMSFYVANLVSFVLHQYMRKAVRNNDQVKLYYQQTVKILY